MTAQFLFNLMTPAVGSRLPAGANSIPKQHQDHNGHDKHSPIIDMPASGD